MMDLYNLQRAIRAVETAYGDANGINIEDVDFYYDDGIQSIDISTSRAGISVNINISELLDQEESK